MSWRESLHPLTFRAFRLLLAGRLADNLAHAIAPIALAFAVLDLGGTPSQLGLVRARDDGERVPRRAPAAGWSARPGPAAS